MNTPKWIVDSLAVLTSHLGKLDVDHDCDGTFYYYHWMGFYMNSGPSICHFSGNGMYATYLSGYDLHPFALGIEKIFNNAKKVKAFIQRIKRAVKFFFGVRIYTKEMVVASWKISKTKGYCL